MTSEKPVPLSPVDRLSPRALARIAGGLYLVNIVFGAFAIGYAPSVPGLSRWAIAAHMVVGLTNPPLALIFYELFRVVGRRLALLNVFFTLVATAIEMAFVAVQAAIQTASAAGYDVSSVFFSFDLITIGWLVFRSGFVPRAIGVLLVIGAVAYLIYGFADIVALGFVALLVPWIQLPSLVGELTFTLWLLIVGVDSGRWLVARDQVPRQG